MKYLFITKVGSKDVGSGEAPYIDSAFDQAVTSFMHYAICEKVITNANDNKQRDAAFSKLRPHFEIRYIG